MNLVELTGQVVIQKFGQGSKSEHDAVYLVIGKKKHRLKRRGGNPFYDESLHSLIGKTIKAKGYLNPHFFEITEEPVVLKKE